MSYNSSAINYDSITDYDASPPDTVQISVPELEYTVNASDTVSSDENIIQFSSSPRTGT